MLGTGGAAERRHRSGPPRLGEATEGRLVTATGRLDAKPTKTAAGDITLVLERDGGTPSR